MAKKRTNNEWLEKIFSVGSISLIVSLIGVYIAYKTFMFDTGGELKSTYTAQAKQLMSEDGTILAVNEQSSPVINDFLPQLSNPSEYMLKDFVLHYDFDGEGFIVEPTDFFRKARGRHSQTLTYAADRLGAGLKIEDPVKTLSADDTWLNIRIRIDASFNGSEKPFHQTVNLFIMYVPRGSLSANAWLDKVRILAQSRNVIAYADETMSHRLALNTPRTSPDSHIDDTAVISPSETQAGTDIVVKKKDDKFPTWLGLILVVVGVFLCAFAMFGFSELFSSFISGNHFGLRRNFYYEVFDTTSPVGFQKVISDALWISGWIVMAFIVFIVLFVLHILIFD